jgi:hypothetical protein
MLGVGRASIVEDLYAAVGHSDRIRVVTMLLVSFARQATPMNSSTPPTGFALAIQLDTAPWHDRSMTRAARSALIERHQRHPFAVEGSA